MCFIMEYIGYFTFGMHWIYIWSIFHETMTWSCCQWAAHLTHSLAYELNGLPIGYLLQLVVSWKLING